MSLLQFKKIKKINRITCPSRVYNFNVPKFESYVANGFIVHNCENWMVSQRDRAHDAKVLSATDVVALAKSKNCEAVCFTYNEPIIYFEFVIDVAKECRKNGLDVILKTNAYAEREPWLELIEYADALNIDWKGTNEQYREVARADDSAFWPRVTECFDAGKHVEVSVPVYFDAKIADFEALREFFGQYPNTPIHLLKIFPANKIMLNPSTPDRVLYRIRDYLLERLNYIYIANVFSDPKLHSTNCKNCNKLLIERESLRSIVHVSTPCCNACPITYENNKQRSVCSP